MEEQPVALATISRSPNNWEINFTYGVSPQPAQAPENSNNGCANCEFFTLLLMSTKSCLLFTFFTQYSQFGASASSLFQRNHRERLAQFRIARTYVGTVAATQAVHYAHLDAEVHALHGCRSLHFDNRSVEALHFFGIENERTDRSVRTNVCTLVTLDTVVCVPCRDKGCHTAFFRMRPYLAAKYRPRYP